MKGIKMREDFSATLNPGEREVKQILSVTESTRGDTKSRITTIVEAIHPGMTKNRTFYPSNRLAQSISSWTNPYNKPVLTHHNSWDGEPLGRVRSAEFTKSTLKPESECIKLELDISDKDAIEKILDGRYVTLSIGCTVYSLSCSICNKDLIAEGFCGHWKGRKYDGKECYWIVGELEFDEISFVNVPADSSAQVLVPDAGKTTEGRGDVMTNEDLTPDAINIIEQIDLIRAQQEEETSPPENPTPQDAPTVEELQNKILQLEADLVSKQSTIQTLETERDALAVQVATLQAEETKLNNELAAAQSESKNMFKQNMDLANHMHRLLAEKVVGLQLVLGEIQESDKANKLSELAKCKAAELTQRANELVEKRPQRQIQTVTNPGLGINSPGDADGAIESTANKQAPSIEEATQLVLDRMYPQRKQTRRNK